MTVGIDRYPSDPGDPVKRIEERLRLLESQVAEQNRRNPLNRGTFDGTLRVRDGGVLQVEGGGQVLIGDEAGNSIGGIGKITVVGLDGTTEETGVLLQDENGVDIFLVTDKRGQVYPPPQFEWRNLNDPKLVTSATFTSNWQGIPRYLSGDGVEVLVAVSTDADTTGEVRLQAIGPGGSPAVVSSAISLPAASSPDYRTFVWDLGAHGFVRGFSAFIDVQARRTGGTGNVNVFQPLPLIIRDAAFMGATSTGV